MCDGIRSSDSESSVQNAREESDTVAPTGEVLKVLPDKRTACVLIWHCCHHNDRYQPAADNQECSSVLQIRDESVAKDHEGCAEPGDDDERDVRVPWLNDKAWMKDSVHLNGHVGRNRDDGCQIEDPSKEVERSSEKSNDASPPSSRSD